MMNPEAAEKATAGTQKLYYTRPSHQILDLCLLLRVGEETFTSLIGKAVLGKLLDPSNAHLAVAEGEAAFRDSGGFLQMVSMTHWVVILDLETTRNTLPC
jgi:hypothetical protein